MKNIHVLPTDKPSVLYKRNDLKTYHLGDFDICNPDDKLRTNQNIYITSDEEIKYGNYVFNEVSAEVYRITILGDLVNYEKKIILTTDQDLIKDGVQAIDDEFLEWFVNNPSCEEVDVGNDQYTIFNSEWKNFYKIIIPKEEPKKIFNLPIATNLGSALTETMKSVSQHEGGIKHGEINLPNFKKEVRDFKKQETLEEAAENELRKQNWDTTITLPFNGGFIEGFQQGVKWQAERMYSEEEAKKLIVDFLFTKGIGREVGSVNEWFEQFKKK